MPHGIEWLTQASTIRQATMRPSLHHARHALYFFACLFVAASWAGEDKESDSEVPGLFFAWTSADRQGDIVTVRFLDQPADLRAMADHCRRGLSVYAFQRNTPYTCTADWYSSPEVLGVTVHGPRQAGPPHYAMFSLKPTRTTRWAARAITANERANVQALVHSRQWQRTLPKARLRLDGAKAVSRAQTPARVTIVVPGRRVQIADGHYDAQRHHVFVQTHGRLDYHGEIPDMPAHYIDVDGDDLPEIITEETCDGYCVSLWRIAKTPQRIAGFGGH